MDRFPKQTARMEPRVERGGQGDCTGDSETGGRGGDSGPKTGQTCNQFVTTKIRISVLFRAFGCDSLHFRSFPASL